MRCLVRFVRCFLTRVSVVAHFGLLELIVLYRCTYHVLISNFVCGNFGDTPALRLLRVTAETCNGFLPFTWASPAHHHWRLGSTDCRIEAEARSHLSSERRK